MMSGAGKAAGDNPRPLSGRNTMRRQTLAAAIAANTWQHLVEHGQDIEECLK